MTAYLIVTAPVEDENVEDFGNWLTAEELPWWHWIDNTWIVIDEERDARGWRNEVRQRLEARWLLVVHLPPGVTIGGVIPKPALDWMHEHLHIGVMPAKED